MAREPEKKGSEQGVAVDVAEQMKPADQDGGETLMHAIVHLDAAAEAADQKPEGHCGRREDEYIL